MLQPKRKNDEPRWHAGIAVLVAIILYVTLPPRIIAGPLWLFPVLILAVLLPLMVLSPHRHQEPAWQRWMSIGTVVLVNAANVTTIVLLFIWLLSGNHHRSISGAQLFVAAVQIWITNVIVYALWFWEIDGRGPDWRSHANLDERTLRADFLFPQQILDKDTQEALDFHPRFLDYVFLSFTNATAFSPTDTFPLTHQAKVLMMAEAVTSLVTIAVIAGRAINILG